MDEGGTILSERIPTEHEEQREVVRWVRQTWPGVIIFAIPNGGARSPATAGRLKLEGVLAGVPDLFVPDWALFVEMKRQKGGTVSADQKIIIAKLRAVGYQVLICKGADEAKRQIVEFLNQENRE